MTSMIRILPQLVFAVALCIGVTVVTARAETPWASIAFETTEGSTSMKALWI